MREAVEARILRAIEGPRQLQEVMTAFWFNHFNIFAGKELCAVWTGSFEQDAIRPHTMGRFRDLLGATARHPAMLYYLDNWQNTAPGSPGSKGRFEGINENYARELMELHTLGVNGGYSQSDVIALAHILTGWGMPKAGRQRRDDRAPPTTTASRFFAACAIPGAGRMNASSRRRQDMGTGPHFTSIPIATTSAARCSSAIRSRGAAQARSSKRSICWRSIRRPQSILAISSRNISSPMSPRRSWSPRMASRYSASDGNIREVLATMFASAEFWDRRHFRAKYKTPYEYVISSVRAAGTPVTNFRPLAGTMQLLGMPTYGCLTPNGYSNTQDAWLNPDAMMARLSFATALGTGNLPLERPPFEAEANGDNRGYFNKKGTTNIKFDANPDRPGRKMEAPDATSLTATLGNLFSTKTRDAIETAPPQLRAAMVLGSPEFMMR